MYQFRLSTLLIAITVLAVYCAIPGMFGISPGAWTIGSICFGLCLLFWRKIIFSSEILRGDTSDDALRRMVIGIVASGALFGNFLGAQLVLDFLSLNDPISILITVSLIIFGGSLFGGLLSGFVSLFVRMFAGVFFDQAEDSPRRAVLSSLIVIVTSVGCMLPFLTQRRLDESSTWALQMTCFAICFGAIGGGLPELLKIRYDRRLAQEAEASVPRETTGEVD